VTTICEGEQFVLRVCGLLVLTVVVTLCLLPREESDLLIDLPLFRSCIRLVFSWIRSRNECDVDLGERLLRPWTPSSSEFA